MLQFLWQNVANSQQQTTYKFGTNRAVNIADIPQQEVGTR